MVISNASLHQTMILNNLVQYDSWPHETYMDSCHDIPYIDISISCSPLYGISSMWIRIIWPHNQVSSFNWPQAVWVMNAESTWCHLIIIPVPQADRGKGLPGSNNTCKQGMYLGVFNGNGLDVLIYLSCDDLYVVCADDCIFYASTYEVTGWCLTYLTLYIQ